MAVAIAGTVLTGALGVAPVAPARAATAGATGAARVDALAALPVSSLSSLLSAGAALLAVGTVVPLTAGVLGGLSGPLQLAPAVIAVLPVAKLLELVGPVVAALPMATLVGLVGAVVSALALTTVPGLLGSVVGTAGGVPGGAGVGAAALASTTTSTPLSATTTAVPAVVLAAARTSPQAQGPVGSRCTAARDDVEAVGLMLPAQFEYRCPGRTETFVGDRQHWGTACFLMSLCPTTAYIAINPGRIGPSEARLRYVVAHETCHALDALAHRSLDEAAADACAAAHGFVRV